jgi:UDP-N-acetylglucosamine transferase subunit ALG13
MKPKLILASLGTDHHSFDRLVDWMDELATSLGDEVTVFVQHGHSAAPRVAQGAAFLSQEELCVLLAEATMVVTHGGPGTITDARRFGHTPICVPREPARGEHVDGHQVRFATFMSLRGLVTLADGPDRLRDHAERNLAAASDTGRSGGDAVPEPAGQSALVAAVEEVLQAPFNRWDALRRLVWPGQPVPTVPMQRRPTDVVVPQQRPSGVVIPQQRRAGADS